MRRRWVKNVSAAKRLAGERVSNKGHMAVENGRPVRAVAPKAGESGRRPTRAEPELEAPVRDQVEHRRVFGDADGLVERQRHDARAKANSRCARCGMREKHKRGRKTALVPVEVMLSDPGRIEAVSLRVNDLLGREAIPLPCGRLIEKPGEETEPSRFRLRHASATSVVHA